MVGVGAERRAGGPVPAVTIPGTGERAGGGTCHFLPPTLYLKPLLKPQSFLPTESGLFFFAKRPKLILSCPQPIWASDRKETTSQRICPCSVEKKMCLDPVFLRNPLSLTFWITWKRLLLWMMSGGLASPSMAFSGQLSHQPGRRRRNGMVPGYGGGCQGTHRERGLGSSQVDTKDFSQDWEV